MGRNKIHAFRHPASEASVSLCHRLLRVVGQLGDLNDYFTAVSTSEGNNYTAIVRGGANALTDVRAKNVILLPPRFRVDANVQGGMVSKSSRLTAIGRRKIRSEVALPSTRKVARYEARTANRKHGNSGACSTATVFLLGRLTWVDHRGVHFSGKITRMNSAGQAKYFNGLIRHLVRPHRTARNEVTMVFGTHRTHATNIRGNKLRLQKQERRTIQLARQLKEAARIPRSVRAPRRATARHGA